MSARELYHFQAARRVTTHSSAKVQARTLGPGDGGGDISDPSANSSDTSESDNDHTDWRCTRLPGVFVGDIIEKETLSPKWQEKIGASNDAEHFIAAVTEALIASDASSDPRVINVLTIARVRVRDRPRSNDVDKTLHHVPVGKGSDGVPTFDQELHASLANSRQRRHTIDGASVKTRITVQKLRTILNTVKDTLKTNPDEGGIDSTVGPSGTFYQDHNLFT